ncbi:MAG: RidA family protein [Mycobacterium sp.]
MNDSARPATVGSTYRERLAARNISLPTPPSPAAQYIAANVCGDLVFIAGQLPFVEGVLPSTGRLGAEVDVQLGRDLARTAALNALAVAEQALGGLDEVRVAQMTVFVASTNDFFEQHLVADGASRLLTDVLGDAGLHARAAVATPVLPFNSPVEVSLTLAVPNPSPPDTRRADQ